MVWKNLSGYTSLRAAFRIYLSPTFATTDHVTVMQFLNGWTNILSLTINDDRTLYLWNDVPLPAGEAYGYLTTPVISTGTWHLLEFQATISPTAGEARLWLDGNLEVEETGLNLGSNPIDRYAAGIYWTNPRTEANLLYFDEAALVQWVDPAPTTGLAGEEASTCGPTATPTNTPTATPLPTNTPTPTATTASGLVAHWEFDEGSGQTAADSSGTGNNGTLGTTGGVESADPTWACVSGGNALNFDGVDDQVLAPDYDVLSTISISTWIKWDVVGASEGIISKRTDSEVAGNWALRGDNTTPGYLEWMVWSGLDSSESLLTSTAITPGVWTHVALTFNASTNAANFYIDGAPNSSGTISNNLANTPQPIVIGWSGQNVQFFDGSIDDMRIYNRVLSPAEISALAATPPANCVTSPVWWDANFAYRARITVSAGASAIPANYPTRFTLDHAGLVGLGKSLANGNDARIVYWNGSSWTELPRALFDDGPAGQASSTWNQAGTTVMFKTAASIPASGTDVGYYLYYGYPLAGSPPTNTPSSRYYIAEDLGVTARTLTSYANKVSLSFTPSATSEQWVVLATWRMRRDPAQTIPWYTGHGRVTVNGTPRTGNDEIVFRMAQGVWKTFQVVLKITGTTANQTIGIDFASDGGDADEIDNARILAFLIPDPASADIRYAETLALAVDSTNPTNSQTLTFSPSSAGDYVWLVNGFFHEGPGGGSNGGLFARDEIAMDQQNSGESYIPNGEGFVPLVHFEQRSLTTGSKTFTIRHQPDTVSGSERQGLTQLLFRTGVFDAVEVAASANLTSTGSTAPVIKNTLTTAGTGSPHDYIYLIVSGMDHLVQDVNLSVYGDIRIGGSTVLAEEVAIDRTTNPYQIALAYPERTSGNRTIETRYWAEAGQTAVAQYAHTLALRYKEPGTSLGAEE
jgi:hypothetical protein